MDSVRQGQRIQRLSFPSFRLGQHALQNIRPQFRQWCFRLLRENLLPQSNLFMQESTPSSSTHTAPVAVLLSCAGGEERVGVAGFEVGGEGGAEETGEDDNDEEEDDEDEEEDEEEELEDEEELEETTLRILRS